jgi:hypothetical protein
VPKEIKDRLFRVWADKRAKIDDEYIYNEQYIQCDIAYLWGKYEDKTIHEIKTLMQKDGIELSEINKIIEG